MILHYALRWEKKIQEIFHLILKRNFSSFLIAFMSNSNDDGSSSSGKTRIHYSNFYREFQWKMCFPANDFATLLFSSSPSWFIIIIISVHIILLNAHYNFDVRPQNVSLKYFEIIMVFFFWLLLFLRCRIYGTFQAWFIHKGRFAKTEIFSSLPSQWREKKFWYEKLCNKGRWFCKFFIIFFWVDLHQRRFYLTESRD